MSSISQQCSIRRIRYIAMLFHQFILTCTIVFYIHIPSGSDAFGKAHRINRYFIPSICTLGKREQWPGRIKISRSGHRNGDSNLVFASGVSSVRDAIAILPDENMQQKEQQRPHRSRDVRGNSHIDNLDKYKVKNVATFLRLLQPYTSTAGYNKNDANKMVENDIVRFGRKGRTDQAMELYFAVHTLDKLRQLFDAKMARQVRSGSINKKEVLMNIVSRELPDHNDGLTTGESISKLHDFLESARNIRLTTRLLNSAIDACARASPIRKEMSFQLFHRACTRNDAEGEGGFLSPNAFTFGSLLAACARTGDVDASLELLRDLEDGIKYRDVVPNGVIYSTVISACERRAGEKRGSESEGGGDVMKGMVQLALELLNNATLALAEKVGPKSHSMGGGVGVVGFNSAISTMAQAAQWKMAVQLLDEMIILSNASSPLNEDNNITYSSRQFSNLSNKVPLLHVVRDSKHSDKRFVIPSPDEVTFGTVLAACERALEWEELLRIARAARLYGVHLDGMALTSVLHACQQMGLADEALEYLELMKGLGIRDEVGGRNGIRGGEGERMTNGRMRKGAKQALRGPDGVAYRLAITACARSPGRWQDCLRLLDEMREFALRSNSTANAPDVAAYTVAIAGCSEAGEYTHAMRLLKIMREEGIQPNVVTFSAVINACASASAQMAKKRDDGDQSIDIEDVRLPMTKALRLLEAMKSPTSTVKPNIVTYNAAIRACAEGMYLDGAFELLSRLKNDGLEPTVVTYGSLMTACERVGNVNAASKVFRMVKDGDRGNDAAVRANEIIYGAAISCCRKAGQPERALLLLRKMISEHLAPNTATFNTVIAALSEGNPTLSTTNNHPLLEKALHIYKLMRSQHSPTGATPNRQTYNILIRNLATNLQPLYAESLLDDMLNDGLAPDVDLYTITVRSYERCGNPKKALSLMESMTEVGYDFYEMKVLDNAFKNGVKILNRMTGKDKGSSSSFTISSSTEDNFGFGNVDHEDKDKLFS